MPKTIEELQVDLDTVTADRDDLKSQLHTVQGEAKGHRLNHNRVKADLERVQAELDTLTNKQKDHDAAIERVRIDLTAQLNAKQTELDQRTVADKQKRTSDMLAEAANRFGLIDPDYLKLFDTSALTIADDGTVERADEALAAFKAAKPHLFGAPARPGQPAPGAPLRQPPRPAQATVPDARTMTKEEKADLRRQITSGTYQIA